LPGEKEKLLISVIKARQTMRQSDDDGFDAARRSARDEARVDADTERLSALSSHRLSMSALYRAQMLIAL